MPTKRQLFKRRKPATTYQANIRARTLGGVTDWATVAQIVTSNPDTPSTPTNFEATYKPYWQHIRLTWNRSTPFLQISHYRLYRDTVNVKPAEPYKDHIKTIVFLDTEVEKNLTYYYWVTAVSRSDVESASATDFAGTGAPSVPTSLALDTEVIRVVLGIGIARATLSWTCTNGAEIYTVQWKQSDKATWHRRPVKHEGLDSDTQYFTIPFTWANKEYNFRVKAWNALRLASDWSTTLTATTSNVSALPAITDLTADQVALRRIKLDWSDIEGATKYKIYWDTFSPPTTLRKNVRTSHFTTRPFADGTLRYFAVKSIDEQLNESAISNIVSSIPRLIVTADIDNSQITTPLIVSGAVQKNYYSYAVDVISTTTVGWQTNMWAIDLGENVPAGDRIEVTMTVNMSRDWTLTNVGVVAARITLLSSGAVVIDDFSVSYHYPATKLTTGRETTVPLIAHSLIPTSYDIRTIRLDIYQEATGTVYVSQRHALISWLKKPITS